MSAQFQAQTVEYPSNFEAPRFSFLSKPPPQKRRAAKPCPTTPLPATPGSPPPMPHGHPVRMRSNPNSGILAWAAHVQPGSPAPRSPHRRLSITSTSSRRSSISRLSRRPSISHGRAPSGSSFIHIIDSPVLPQRTPSTGKFDLTTLGYASVFIQFPKTPTTPSPYLRQHSQKREQGFAAPVSPKAMAFGPLSASIFASIPIPPIPQDAPKHKGMKRFRSLSILRPRSSKTKSHGASPSSPAPISPTKTAISTKSANAAVVKAAKKQQLAITAAAITRRKQAKYAYKSVRPPPTLANELALMQFADGGSLESHAKRVMESQAKAAKGCGTGAGVGVGDVYRDGKGGMWWDADEEMEYAPLLGGKTVQETMKESRDAAEMEMDWEEFNDAVTPLTPFHNTARLHHLAAVVADASLDPMNSPRRSRASVSTQDSDLDPRRILPLPENEDPRALMDDRVLASRQIGGAGMSVLSLPSRPRRALPHLRQPAAFLVDAAAFAPRSPVAPHALALKTPLTPTTFVAGGAHVQKAKTKVRRRPAPLKLTSSAYGSVRSRRSPAVARRAVAAAALPSPAPPQAAVMPSLERTRREFIEDSFAPAPSPGLPAMRNGAALNPLADARMERSSKRKGVLGLFALTRKMD
ncbi:hypothetical protein BJ912DRAFT_1038025 [Pholiota molesta]|nr:hypothetical protein BJ912DRAFT_1038025 [Pholiota molesta]